MQTVTVLCLATLAMACAHSLEYSMTTEKQNCYKALKSSGTKAERHQMWDDCVAQQDELKAIIDEYKSQEEKTDAKKGEKRGYKKHSAMWTYLETNGYAANVLNLRKCLAGKHNLLKTNGAFNIEGYKAELLAKVAGTAQETNTKLGLQACPTDGLVNYNMWSYFKCVKIYCTTGAAPVTAISPTAA